MLIVISPAKNLDYKTTAPVTDFTQPDYLKQSSKLIKRLRDIEVPDLMKLYSVSREIASLNYERYKQWHLPFTPENAKQAVFAFNGEVYNGLKAKTLAPDDIQFAQGHLRMLSGLYGVLRPLDLIQPYRLEMGIKLDTAKAENLYEFWDNKITKNLNEVLKSQIGEESVLINLASHEYFKAIHRKSVKARIIDFEFVEMRDGKPKPITVYMKKARGMMTRFIIENRLIDPEQLKAFDTEGYAFVEDFSEKDRWVFVR
ncbi:peroxide stress protein YaaA [Parabacteroides sp. FAFU027]|uniref:peroxide stress protein YaaA n=1 Tax=Parabacteroides sp. FAFU027 TaxID=2922715 RepID=UPI001FAF98D9|nr:peroxide stress protein YaaA [Parabacteroides sp. FAFU027]